MAVLVARNQSAELPPYLNRAIDSGVKPDELNEKLPQAVNLNSFPTTFVIGRDGLVRSVHAGFPGKASGRFHTEARKEITGTVERLLAERAQTTF